MLTSTLLSGLVGAFGSVNVVEPFGYQQWRGTAGWAMQTWPIFLAATTYMGKPEPTKATTQPNFDAYVVNARFITEAVKTGLCTEDIHNHYLHEIDPSKTVIYDGSDSPSWKSHAESELLLRSQFRLFAHRPGIGKAQWTDSRGNVGMSQLVHISVPLHHIWRMMAKADVYPCAKIRIYCAHNDNHALRRQCTEALVASNIPDRIVRFGSGSGYKIDGALPSISPPYFYRELSMADLAVAIAGGNADTLRHWEILALGRAMICTPFGFDDDFRDGEHCYYFNTPDEMLKKIWHCIDNADEAKAVAKRGHEKFLIAHTPEQQAWNILKKAGLLN